MRLTHQQRTAIRVTGNALVVACPGSGKTRTIIAKLLRCLDDVRDTSRRIACITYTRAAVDEIESRVRRFGSSVDEAYHDISTIHTFCLTNVLRHYHWRTCEYRAGFTILAPDSEEYQQLVRQVFERHALDNRARDQFELVNRNSDGRPIVADSRITEDAVLDFWQCLADRGAIDFPNIVYQSYRILAQNPHIARGLACRYRWILVDEFQDTSELQVEILRLIATSGICNFFLVGDPLQSIFGFAGARPDLMEAFAEEICAKRDLPLLGNFRCSHGIVVSAEALLPRNPPMEAVGRYAEIAEAPVHVHADTCFAALTDHYLPAIDALEIPYGAAAILAPWWITLLKLGRLLRGYGVPIVGPGARPYKRSRLLATLAEQAGAYAESGHPQYVRPTERALSFLVESAGHPAGMRVFTFEGRRAVCRILRCAESLRRDTSGGIEWLRLAASEFGKILVEEELIPDSAQELLIQSVLEMEDDMLSNGVDTANLQVRDLGIYADPDANLKLMSLHSAKGREFESVAIVDVHDGRVPHFSAKTQEEIQESRRVFYVGITRAERLLTVITDQERWQNRPSPFLQDLGLLVRLPAASG